jgi:CelD/BcsL family acetyltransferase involved in cellulose biosynthesis
MLELELCVVGGRPIAGAYVLARRDAHLYLTGFDPAYERCSAGSVVIGRSIARAIAAGRRSYDFLRGAEPYKYAWGATDAVTLCVSFAAERASPPERVA